MSAAQTSALALPAPALMPPAVGVLGHRWRASISPWGSIEQRDGSGRLDWYVAADDRWHTPEREPTVRQSLVGGTPVVETRLRIPQGDAVQRVYSVADHGGLTLVEVDNDSPLPIAVAFAGTSVLSVRRPAAMMIEGIDLPGDAVVFPIGHHASLTVALAHTAELGGALPGGLPSAAQVSRGWLSLCERASRLLLPDAALAQAVVRERCQLLLNGPGAPCDDPIGFLLGVAELVRTGSIADAWMPGVVEAVGDLADVRSDPFLRHALDAAERVCLAGGEARAVRDLAKVRARLMVSGVPAAQGHVAVADSSGVRFVSAVEHLLADGPDLFPAGIPGAWLGQDFEVHGVPTGPSSAVSFALRWHGRRPAVLWECSGSPVTLASSGAAPGWSSRHVTGEALWPEPAGEPARSGDISFG